MSRHGRAGAVPRSAAALLALLAVTWRSTAGQGREAPVIRIAQGTLQGIREYVESSDRPVFAYKGIPYAMPPVGRLRFKPPERHRGWNDSQLFDRFGPACPQLDTQGTPESAVSEDCLTLNVWIPQVPDGFGRYAVIVFLDGELFWRQRASKFPLEELCAEDIVTVSISYRTNVFGFLTLLSREAPGNVGLRDQQLALRWVRDNIGAFGGDPRRVTLVGFSAGAASAGLHTMSPLSQGLFQRTVLMSGSPLAPWARLDGRQAREVGLKLISITNCHNIDEAKAVRCLQDLDFVTLLTAAQSMLESRGRFFPVFAPVTDSFLSPSDRVIPGDPERLLRLGNFAKVPVMAGFDQDDGILMLYQYPGTNRLTFTNLTRILHRVVIPRLLDQYQLKQQRYLLQGVLGYRYIESVPPSSQQLILTSFVKMFSDAYFIAPMYAFLELYARTGATVYAYAFTERGPDMHGNAVSLQGASHGSELLYLLGPTMFRSMVGGTYGSHQRTLGQKLKTHWKTFATDGTPDRARGDQRWATFTLDRPTIYRLTDSASQVGFRRDDASFWNTFLSFIERASSQSEQAAVTTPQSLVAAQPPYRTATWALLAALLLLVTTLLVAFLLTRRRKRSRSDMSFG